MKSNVRKFGIGLMFFVLFLLCVGIAFAADSSKTLGKAAEAEMGIWEKFLVGLFLVDLLVIAGWIHKIYHSIFEVYYFSFGALFKELFVIAFIAGIILVGVPQWLHDLGFSDTIVNIYFVATFVLPIVSIIRKAKK